MINEYLLVYLITRLDLVENMLGITLTISLLAVFFGQIFGRTEDIKEVVAIGNKAIVVSVVCIILLLIIPSKEAVLQIIIGGWVLENKGVVTEEATKIKELFDGKLAEAIKEMVDNE